VTCEKLKKTTIKQLCPDKNDETRKSSAVVWRLAATVRKYYARWQLVPQVGADDWEWPLADGVSFYLSFFVSLLARLRENGWTDLHEIFREGVEWSRDGLINIFGQSQKTHDAAMRSTGTGFVVLSHHSLYW